MQIQFKGTNYDLASEMTDLADKKLQSLRKYLGKDDSSARAYVDLGKVTEAHQSGAIWFAEINLDFDGKRYNARSEDESLRTAIDTGVADLERELRGAKQKHESLLRRGGARVKRFFGDFRNG